jgi:hypothetical protein
MPEDEKETTLTEADVDLVIDRFYKRLSESVGHNILSMLWKGFVLALFIAGVYLIGKEHP